MLPQALLVHVKPNHWGVFPGFGMVRPQRAPNKSAVHCQITHLAQAI